MRVPDSRLPDPDAIAPLPTDTGRVIDSRKKPQEIFMMSRLQKAIPLALAIAFAGPAWSYDTAMAESYAELFAPVHGADAGKALHLMSAKGFIDKVQREEPLVVLDIRTPAETGIFGMTLPDSLAIPLNELFTAANLARLPTDRTVVVICKSGTRASAAGTALRHIGFDNVYILKGGFAALAGYTGPKEVNTPPQKPQPASTRAPVPYPMGWPPMPAPYPAQPAR
jgi:rhodanese-related sulfurtransferase